MKNLIKAESLRIAARRSTLVTVIIVLFSLGIATWSAYTAISPMPPTETQAAERAYEQAMKEYTDAGGANCQPTESNECRKEPPTRSMFMKTLQPFTNTFDNTLSSTILMGFFLAFVASTLTITSEFSTGAMSNFLSFVPNRPKVFAAKLIVTIGFSLVFAAGITALSLVVVPLLHLLVPGSPPLTSLAPMASLMGRSVLFVIVGGLLGFLFGMLTKNAAISISLFLGYAFFSQVVFMLVLMTKMTFVMRFLPDVNLEALFRGSATRSFYSQVSNQIEAITVSMTHASVYWLVALVLFTALGIWSFKRRDIN